MECLWCRKARRSGLRDYLGRLIDGRTCSVFVLCIIGLWSQHSMAYGTDNMKPGFRLGVFSMGGSSFPSLMLAPTHRWRLSMSNDSFGFSSHKHLVPIAYD